MNDAQITVNVTDWCTSTALIAYSVSKLTVNNSQFYFDTQSDIFAGLVLIVKSNVVLNSLSHEVNVSQNSTSTNVSLLFLNNSGPSIVIN